MYSLRWKFDQMTSFISLLELAETLEGEASRLREMHKAGVVFNHPLNESECSLSCDDRLVANYYGLEEDKWENHGEEISHQLAKKSLNIHPSVNELVKTRF